jgi:hypothetical protein
MKKDHFPEFMIKMLSTQVQSFEQHFDCSKNQQKQNKIVIFFNTSIDIMCEMIVSKFVRVFDIQLFMM